MDESRKREPQSLDPDEKVRAALARAVEGTVDPDLSISFHVSGGPPASRYRLEYRTSGSRLTSGSLECGLRDRHGTAPSHEVDVPSLARRLLESGVMDIQAEPPGFLPDTLVGIIEIAAGDHRRRIYFAADPDQASVQNRTPPSAVLRAVDALYNAAGSALSREDVRP